METHLAACPRCREEVADLQVMLHALHEVPAERLPEGLIADVTRATTRRLPTRTARMSWTRIAVPAAVTTGVLAILLVWHGQEPMRTASLGETQKAAVSAPKPLPATPPPAPSPAPPEDRAGRTGGERGACEVSASAARRAGPPAACAGRGQFPEHASC